MLQKLKKINQRTSTCWCMSVMSTFRCMYMNSSNSTIERSTTLWKTSTWVIKIRWIIVIDYGNLWTRITLRSSRRLIYWTLSGEALFWRWKLIAWRSNTATLSLPLIPMQYNGNSSLIIHDLPRWSFIMKFQGMNRLADDFWYGRYC